MLLDFMAPAHSFEFIVALVVSLKTFIHNLSRYHFRRRTWRLQKDIKVHNFSKRSLSYVRESLQAYHKKWFEVAVELGSKTGTVPTSPRLCSQQTLRENPPAKTSEEYYCRASTIPRSHDNPN